MCALDFLGMYRLISQHKHCSNLSTFWANLSIRNCSQKFNDGTINMVYDVLLSIGSKLVGRLLQCCSDGSIIS